MALTASVNKILDGPRNYVVRLQGITTDTTNESAVTKVDASTLAGPDGAAPSYFAVKRIKGSTNFPNVQLLFDATTDDELATLTGDFDMEFDPPFNDPQSTGSTGDINLTTVGAAAGYVYDITLWLVKKQ